MSVSRVLPATLAPRFASAPRAICRADSAAFEVVVAERFLLRLRGLAGLDEGAIVPLLFPHCRSLHTFGMRAPLDVVWLDLEAAGHAEIRAVDLAIGRRRTARAPQVADRHRIAALELAAGDAVALGLRTGAGVVISDDG